MFSLVMHHHHHHSDERLFMDTIAVCCVRDEGVAI